MSRDTLAQRLGTSRLRVWRMETGKIKVDADNLPAIAVALETTVAALVPSEPTA